MTTAICPALTAHIYAYYYIAHICERCAELWNVQCREREQVFLLRVYKETSTNKAKAHCLYFCTKHFPTG